MSSDAMVRRDFLLPDVGEGLTEAEVVRWHVQPGQHVEVNQPLAEIETAKALVELPCPYSGVVTHLLVDVGVVIAVGTSIATFEVSSSPTQDAQAPQPLLVGYGAATPDAAPSRRRQGARKPIETSPGVRAKPPVRQLARRLGVDLRAVAPTGPGGVVSRDDVARAVADHDNRRGRAVPVLPGDVRALATGVQRAMAQAMTESVSVPQATVWRDVDVTHALRTLVELRNHTELVDVRVTPLTLVCHTLISAVRTHPHFTALWDDSSGEVVQRADVRMGIAVATDRGLLVPHFSVSDALTLTALARTLTNITTAAREGRTTPDQLLPGSVTVTNVGVFGVDGGTPLLYPGESAIVAVGRVNERPWVVDGEVTVRSVLRLSVTFDHRHIDGALASRVLADMSDRLEALAGVIDVDEA